MSGSRVVDDPDAGQFVLFVDDRPAGVAQYHRNGTDLEFTHTVVDPAFAGRGLGSVLARAALDAARAAGDAVLPYCPFVNAFIRRHPEYLDLVPAARRAGFGLTAPS